MNKNLLIVGVLVFAYVIAGVGLPRGIRNKNPGNIRHGDNWVGMSAYQGDESFVQFTHVKYGIRAMARILASYERRDVVYLVDIISTWAPQNENNVGAYLDRMEKETGIYGNEIVRRERWPQLIAAMIKHENGFNPYPMSVINEGVELA